MAAALAALFAGCAGTPCARRRQTCVRGNGTGEGGGVGWGWGGMSCQYALRDK